MVLETTDDHSDGNSNSLRVKVHITSCMMSKLIMLPNWPSGALWVQMRDDDIYWSINKLKYYDISCSLLKNYSNDDIGKI